MSKYVFVVDTEDYAGNFDGRLAAYLTGHYHEENAEIFAKLFKDEVGPPLWNVEEAPDKDGFSRCYTMWPTPGWFNNGQGRHFREGADKEALFASKCYVKQETRQRIRRALDAKKALRAGATHGNMTVEDCDKEIQEAAKLNEESQKQTQIKHFPAYLSVGIFFASIPSEAQITMLKARAHKFPPVFKNLASWPKDTEIKVIGFRLVTLREHNTEVSL